MRNSGMTFISILFAVVLISILGVVLLKYTNVYNPEADTEQTSLADPMEEARAVECLMHLEAIAMEIKMYKVQMDMLPHALDEVTDDYVCPVTGVEYEYDDVTGEVWCPDHS